MVAMANKLSDDDRGAVEEAIIAAHVATDQVLKTDRVMYEKILNISVSEAMHILKSLREQLQDDEKFESYKLHILVPLQLQKLLEIRKAKKNDIKS